MVHCLELSQQLAHVLDTQMSREHVEVIDSYLDELKKDNRPKTVRHICKGELPEPVDHLLPKRRSPEKRKSLTDALMSLQKFEQVPNSKEFTPGLPQIIVKCNHMSPSARSSISLNRRKQGTTVEFHPYGQEHTDQSRPL